MTWNVLQSVGVMGSGASTVATYTSNVSSGTKLICYFSAFSSSNITVTSVKDGAGNTMTQVAWLWSATSGTGAGIFAMDTPAGDVGTKPVITALLSNGSFGAMTLQEVSGLAVGNTLAAMVDGTAAATAFAAGASHAQPAYSSTAANEFQVSFCGDQGGPQTMTQPAGYTLDAHAVNNNASADCCPAYKNSTGGAESGTWSYSGSTVGSNIAVVAFQLAAGAGATVPSSPAVRVAPGWHPGLGLPGLPGGTPFQSLPPSSPAAVVATGTAGPPVRALSGPVRARFPQYQRGICRAIRSSAPPAVAGTPVRSSENPVRASWPAPQRGSVRSRAGVYAGTGPPVRALDGPVRAQPAATRGGSTASRAGTFAGTGPAVRPPAGPVRARIPQPRAGGQADGRQGTSGGPGPALRALAQAVAGKLRGLPPRGRTASRAGTYQNPGPAVRPAPGPVRPVRQPPPPGGRAAGRTGTFTSAAPQAGPPVYPLGRPVRARFIPAQRGTCRAIRSAAPPAVAGTPVRSSETPVRASWPAVRGGRTASRSGTFTFVSLTSGPPVYPWHGPVEARRLPQRGGTTSSRAGAYGRTGPPVRSATGPVRAQPTAPRGGTVSRRAGTYTAVSLTSGPPVYPLGHPAQARRQPQRGGSVTRRAGVYQGSGPQVPALKQPLGQYRRQPLPPARGRVLSLHGIRSGTGPPVPALRRPVRAQPARPVLTGRADGRAGVAVFVPVTYGTARQGVMTIPGAAAGQASQAHAQDATAALATANATTGQTTIPHAQDGQMTIPRAEGGQ